MTRSATASAAGEGALAGLLAGLVPGVLSIALEQDVAHGLLWLAVQRLGRPLLLGALLGVAVSVLLAFALSRMATPWSRWTVHVILFAGGATGLVVPGPLRAIVLPASAFASRRELIVAIALVLAALLLLLFFRACLTTPRIFAISGGVLFAGAAAFHLASGPLSAGRAAGRPSVIIVSIDTLRADRLGCLGYPRPLTPRLDLIAAEGALFEQALSPAPWTLPAHVSLFTSRLPFDHGVRWTPSRIHPRRSMLAERFRDAGYRTGAFTGGAYVAAAYGFDQGFQIYEDHDEAIEGGPGLIFEAAKEWVLEGGSAPFFLFVHTYEPHLPYVHREWATGPSAERYPEGFGDREFDELLAGRLALTAEDRRAVMDLYDGDVAESDRVVGSFLEALRRRGVLDRSILVILSDHGEELWDHGPERSPGHGHSLYEELLRVPLIVRWPGRIAPGTRVKAPVSLLDVAPTLLEMAALPAEALHQGRSLAKPLREGSEPGPAIVLAESVQYGPDRFAARAGTLKVIATPFPDRVHGNVRLTVRPVEFFDLATDPRESGDRSADLGPEARGLLRTLQARIAAKLRPEIDEAFKRGEPPGEVLEQLRSLGYLR